MFQTRCSRLVRLYTRSASSSSVPALPAKEKAYSAFGDIGKTLSTPFTSARSMYRGYQMKSQHTEMRRDMEELAQIENFSLMDSRTRLQDLLKKAKGNAVTNKFRKQEIIDQIRDAELRLEGFDILLKYIEPKKQADLHYCLSRVPIIAQKEGVEEKKLTDAMDLFMTEQISNRFLHRMQRRGEPFPKYREELTLMMEEEFEREKKRFQNKTFNTFISQIYRKHYIDVPPPHMYKKPLQESEE